MTRTDVFVMKQSQLRKVTEEEGSQRQEGSRGWGSKGVLREAAKSGQHCKEVTSTSLGAAAGF